MVADGLEFAVRAEDAKQIYAPRISDIFTASRSMELRLVMGKGLETKISVNRKDSGGIGRAPIRIKQNNVIMVSSTTGTDGKKLVALKSGQYVLESFPDGYKPGSIS